MLASPRLTFRRWVSGRGSSGVDWASTIQVEPVSDENIDMRAVRSTDSKRSERRRRDRQRVHPAAQKSDRDLSLAGGRYQADR